MSRTFGVTLHGKEYMVRVRETPFNKEVINNYSQDELIRILFEYGEEKIAKSIVSNIIKQRNIKEIQTKML